MSQKNTFAFRPFLSSRPRKTHGWKLLNYKTLHILTMIGMSASRPVLYAQWSLAHFRWPQSHQQNPEQLCAHKFQLRANAVVLDGVERYRNLSGHSRCRPRAWSILMAMARPWRRSIITSLCPWPTCAIKKHRWSGASATLNIGSSVRQKACG